ncbi:WbuC family cupin fold metalloprotein [Bacteroides pyogenes]|uniref:WbuC family cupin fold metalloprotein n=1 Tax=Bacteroides pyogenes TaxID=310300 RepID=UPI0040641583
MEINQVLFDSLFEQAKANPRLRINYDLRTSSSDGSQRMLNALLPGTIVPIHRHPISNENVILLTGRIEEVFYEEVVESVSMSVDFRMMDAQDISRKVFLKEFERIQLCPNEGKYGCQVPKDVWHTVEVIEPSVIYEGKDGKYGEDGSVVFNG